MRRLNLILGDQLDRHSLLFNDVDSDIDCFWMAEVREESTHVWSHKQRIALFLSSMRHFAEELRELKEEELKKLEECIRNARPAARDLFSVKRRFCEVCF